MTNFERITPLMRAIDFENRQFIKNIRKLEFKDVFFGLQKQGFMISKAVNTTHINFKPDPSCGAGKFNFDPRCRYWYKEANKSLSLNVNRPDVSFSQAESILVQNFCQKLKNFDQSSQQDILHHVMCINFPLNKTQEYFNNFGKSIKQSYMIEPLSQVIVFDSNATQVNKTAQKFSDVEFKYIQSQEEAMLFNNTIKKYYSQFIVQQVQSVAEINRTKLHEELTLFTYNRNGTEFTVILNPIYILDKIPKFDGVKNEIQKGGYQMCLTYLQINMISNEQMMLYSNQINNYFQQLSLIIFFCYLLLGIVSIFISIYYAICISNLVSAPINHLTSVLQKLSEEKDKSHQLLNIFDDYSIKAEDIFQSKETKQLYESFTLVFQILIYTSENFFLDNETQTLLKLNKNIEFFKQFQNIYAVGITHNHIGSIFVSQKYYFQAMEHFSQSILYAKYEIQNFCNRNPHFQSVNILVHYCLDNKFAKMELENDESLFKTDSKSKKSSNQENPKLKVEGKNLSISKSKSSTKGQIVDQSDFNRQKFHSKFKSINQFDSKLDLSSKYNEEEIVDDSYHLQSKNEQSEFQNNSSTQSKTFLKNRIPNENENKSKKDTENNDKKQIILCEQGLQLLSSLYYRKKNYVTALIAFQESIEEEQLRKDQKIQYNFWYEIKDLLKELLMISIYLPFEDSNKIELRSNIAKCQFKLTNFNLSQKILCECEKLLTSMQKTQYNNKNDIILSSLHLKNIKSYQISTQKQLKQNQGQSNNNNQMRSKQTLSNLTNREMQTTNVTNIQNKSVQSTILTSTKSPVILSQIQPKRMQTKENKLKKKTVNIQRQSVSYISDDIPSPSNQNPPTERIISQKLLTPNQYQKQQGKINKKLDFSFLNSKIEEKAQDLTNNESSNNIFLQKRKGLDYSQIELDDQDIPMYKKLSLVNQLSANKKNSSQNKTNQINNFSINYQNQQCIQNSMLNSVNQSHVNLVQNNISNQNLNQQKSNQNSNENNFQNKQEESLSYNKQDNSFQNKIGIFKKKYKKEIENVEESQEKIQDMKKKLEEIIENQSLYLLSSSTQQLDFLINFTKAEFYMQKEDYFSAAQIFTETLENVKSFMNHQPFKIIHKLNKIFDKFNIFSQDLNQIRMKFNPNISLKVGIIFSNLDSQRNAIEQMNVLNNLFKKTLYHQNDQLGILYANQSNSLDIIPYMSLSKVKQIKELSYHILQEVYKGITNSQVPLILQNTINMDQSAEQSPKLRNQSFYPSKYYGKPNQQLPTNLDSFDNEDIFNIKSEDNNPYNNNYQSVKSQQELNIWSDQDINDAIPSDYGSKINSLSQIKYGLEKQQDYAILKSQKQLKPIKSQYNSKRNTACNIDLIHEEMEQSKNDQQQQQSCQTKIIIEENNSSKQQNILYFFQTNKDQNGNNKINFMKGDCSMTNISLSSNGEETEKQDLVKEKLDKNQLFHLMIRRSLLLLFQSDINFINQKSRILFESYFQNEGMNEQLFERRYQQIEENSCLKYLIYCTDQIEIMDDSLFQKLIQFLYCYNIQLLISSSAKNNNFLEQQPNQTYQYHNKDIIKVFYSTKIISDYLNSQRDSINKYTYPIIIQHF